MELNDIVKSIGKRLLNLDYFVRENNLEKNCIDNLTNIFDEISDKNKYILICKNCYKSPKITFSGLYNINIECDCHHIINSNYEYFFNNYLKKCDKD